MYRWNSKSRAELWHEGLKKYRVITGTDMGVIKRKAEMQLREWEEMWARRQNIENERNNKIKAHEEAKIRTQEAREIILRFEKFLKSALSTDPSIDWSTLKDFSQFAVPKPEIQKIPREPKPNDHKYRSRLGIIGYIFRSMKQKETERMKAQFEYDHSAWNEKKEKISQIYQEEMEIWEKQRNEFKVQQEKHNKEIDRLIKNLKKHDPNSVLKYFKEVLDNSEYPDNFPTHPDLDYNPTSKLLLVDYQLPTIDLLPRTKEVKYIQTIPEFRNIDRSETEIKKSYDSVLYQIALRSIYEVFQADKVKAVDTIVFNGWIRAIDNTTGLEKTNCILSLLVNKAEFMELNLARVDPKSCFRKFKGTASPELHTITPIAPIMQINRNDKRFVQSHQVMGKIEQGYNLAIMEWEEFEHLVRELFEKEFVQSGGEVKVTQASRDGGVDAIAFDPDPIRGGKIVIQAKRYTNIVGVSAVRDLYGTVINEGATKGILITTSDYGSDAYKFAQGKPITLLNGGMLLHLLQKHGYKVKIDLQEARRILSKQKK